MACFKETATVVITKETRTTSSSWNFFFFFKSYQKDHLKASHNSVSPARISGEVSGGAALLT